MAPDNKPDDPNTDDASGAGAIDTSAMSAGKREALELTEASRDKVQAYPNFAGALFMGQVPFPLIHPFPEPTPTTEQAETETRFLADLHDLLRDDVDADEIDLKGNIPDAVVEKLCEIGAFGIKIPTEFDGLGLTQSAYARAGVLLGSHCANVTALLSAHQSIGLPQPLKMFGTDEQKKKWLPKLAKGAISAFALTEAEVGSDPARMATTATLTEDGQHYIIDGEKLWCTNGTNADFIVVMARTSVSGGKKRTRIGAFVVEADRDGVTVEHRCQFMGLRALFNGVIKFDRVKVPKENLLGEPGKGLKIALTTLNTGRLTIPAALAGTAKRCVRWARQWAAKREQWGHPVGEHAAVAEMLARMTAYTFAMEAVALLSAALSDRGATDIRIEAAMGKMWCSERGLEIVNDCLQIRGGRGYETAQSLKSRGDEPIPVERFVRDARINTLFEGSSEIMRLFIAREALDPHLKVAGDVFKPKQPFGKKLGAFAKAGAYYAGWYPSQYLPRGVKGLKSLHPRLRPHMAYVGRSSRALARRMFRAMAKYGPKLADLQLTLGRFVEIGTELFVLAATCSYAQKLIDADPSRKHLLDLVDLIAHRASNTVDNLFTAQHHNTDREGYKLAKRVLAGELAWLENGIVEAKGDEFHPTDAAPNSGEGELPAHSSSAHDDEAKPASAGAGT